VPDGKRLGAPARQKRMTSISPAQALAKHRIHGRRAESDVNGVPGSNPFCDGADFAKGALTLVNGGCHWRRTPTPAGRHRLRRQRSAGGIEPLAGSRTRTSGVYGGGLELRTVDERRPGRHPVAWPDDGFFFSRPGHTVLGQPPGEPMKVTEAEPSSPRRRRTLPFSGTEHDRAERITAAARARPRWWSA
jgi:hypothetical protein